MDARFLEPLVSAAGVLTGRRNAHDMLRLAPIKLHVHKSRSLNPCRTALHIPLCGRRAGRRAHRARAVGPAAGGARGRDHAALAEPGRPGQHARAVLGAASAFTTHVTSFSGQPILCVGAAAAQRGRPGHHAHASLGASGMVVECTGSAGMCSPVEAVLASWVLGVSKARRSFQSSITNHPQ